MDFTLNEEQTMIVDMVRKFVQQEIIPLENDLDPDADEVDQDTYAKLVEKTKAMGLYGLDTPPEYGGPDISMVTYTYSNWCSLKRGSTFRVIMHSEELVRHNFLKPLMPKRKNIFILC